LSNSTDWVINFRSNQNLQFEDKDVSGMICGEISSKRAI
jgi:hypothetical protein